MDIYEFDTENESSHVQNFLEFINNLQANTFIAFTL